MHPDDQAHSVRYPPAYVPRDNLAVTDELLDWTGDHLHTNMREMFIWLREQVSLALSGRPTMDLAKCGGPGCNSHEGRGRIRRETCV